ncbi:MAG: MBL fold metallo-hydrolase [Woeseia sp.]
MTPGLSAGQLTQLAPGVRRLVAPNPGMMTGPGTNTYIIGRREVAVIDPGPAMAGHVDATLDAIADRVGAVLRWVLVTHTHSDHSPAATLLASRSGAALLGRPPPPGRHQDAAFLPDRVLEDGEVFATSEFTLDVIHTPGHASNHLTFRHGALDWLFTGDHVINGSTVVIDPPDGNMSAYLHSLEKIKSYRLAAIAPGHGELIEEPYAAIDALIRHRLAREKKVLDAVRADSALTSGELVSRVYRDVDSSLYSVAERSLLAHLEKLEADGSVRRDGQRWEALQR